MDAEANFDRTVRGIVRRSDTSSDYRKQARQTAIAHVLNELQGDESVPDDLLDRGIDLLETAAEEFDGEIPVPSTPTSRDEVPGRIEERIPWKDDDQDDYELTSNEDSTFDGPFVIEGGWETRDEARKYAKKILGDVEINIWGIDFSEVGPGRTTRVKFHLDEDYEEGDLPNHPQLSRF